MSRDEETEYFSDGLADELIHLLSQVKGLHVVSHTSSFEFKGKCENIRSIAERLNVTTILEGSLRRSGNTLRITAQLTNAASGYHLWSERYDRELKDVFAIQEDIALSIASTLKLKLKSEIAPVRSRYSGSVEAHALYLKGRYHWEQRTEEGFRKAGQCFQQAITVDPNCAPAFAGLADYFISLGFWGFVSPREAWDRGRELAFQAMQVDDRLAEAEISLAKCALFNHWDWRQAEDRFLRAIELNPALSAGHFSYAILLIQLGRFDSSLLELRCARELDPLSLTIATGVAWAYYYLGRYDRAAEECHKVFDLQPDYLEASACMGLIAIREGHTADAVAWFQRALTGSGGNSLGLGFLGYALALDGRAAEADQTLAQLIKASAVRYVSPIAMALIHIGLSQHDEALRWLENAYDVRDAWLAYAKVFPPYEPLRASPRFRQLLIQIALGGSFDQLTT
jgi:serine/threonine-protein kinase